MIGEALEVTIVVAMLVLAGYPTPMTTNCTETSRLCGHRVRYSSIVSRARSNTVWT